MTDPQRDPIGEAGEGVCRLFTRAFPSAPHDFGDECVDCSHYEWVHWLRDVREQLATAKAATSTVKSFMETERDALRLALVNINICTAPGSLLPHSHAFDIAVAALAQSGDPAAERETSDA